MSTSTPQPSPNPTDQRLENRGIHRLANGGFRLPPVRVEYADGTTQNLILEVGRRRSEFQLGTAAFVTDFLLNRGHRTFPTRFPGVIPGTGRNATSATNVRNTTNATNTANATSTTNATSSIAHAPTASSASNLANLATITTPTNATTTTNSTTNTTSGSQSTTSEHSAEPSRNIILTVNYIYGQTPTNYGDTTHGNTNSQNGITGSLILHVPSINERNEENLQVLVRLATTVALRTISTSIKKASGVPDDVFLEFKQRKLASIPKEDRICPICYDEYKDASPKALDTVNKNGKRPREDDESVQKQTKRQKTKAGEKKEREPVQKKKSDEVKYTHVAVEMPCGHLFGQSCLHEWLKTNNSCPLCRDKIKRTRGSESGYSTTVNLPNLAQVISGSREVIEDFNSRQLTFITPDSNGNINEPEQREPQDTPLATTLPMTFPTIVALNPHSRDTSNNTTISSAATQGHQRPTNASVFSQVRALFQSLGHRLHRPVHMRNDTNTLNMLDSGFLENLPMIRTVHRNGQGHASVIQRDRRHSTGSTSGSMFPVGVMSRRTPHGVVTSSLGGFDGAAQNEALRHPRIDGNEHQNEEESESETRHGEGNSNAHETTNTNERDTSAEGN